MEKASQISDARSGYLKRKARMIERQYAGDDIKHFADDVQDVREILNDLLKRYTAQKEELEIVTAQRDRYLEELKKRGYKSR